MSLESEFYFRNEVLAPGSDGVQREHCELSEFMTAVLRHATLQNNTL